MKIEFASVAVLLMYGAIASASEFACPDEKSRELFSRVQKLSTVHPLSDAEPGFSELIRQASVRPLDDIPLHHACFWLATRTFRTNCSDYGYECPHPGIEILEWPAKIEESIPDLKRRVPALRNCPDDSIRRPPKLPIVRVEPNVTSEIIEREITGWVILELTVDESGTVSDARVISSTARQLEDPAVEAAKKFRYAPEIQGDRRVPVDGVRASIHFSYWLLAAAAGCSISYD